LLENAAVAIKRKPTRSRLAPSVGNKRKPRPVGDKAAVLGAALTLASAIRRRRRDTVERLLARDFSFIDASGRRHSRAAVLRNLAPGPTVEDMRESVRTYGDVALVMGALKSAQADARKDLFALDVWVKGKAGWQALIHHDNVLAGRGTPALHAAAQPRPAGAPPPPCRNPLEIVPYEPGSQAERDVIAAFQTMERAVTENDAAEWMKHVADEFVVYRTGQFPTTREGRIAFIRAQAAINGETYVAEIERMKLWVYGDAVVMRADHVMPGNRRPPYRATRLWVKRDGRWQMAVSQQTTIVR
jgi:ketosteroid isomerase-like protein